MARLIASETSGPSHCRPSGSGSAPGCTAPPPGPLPPGRSVAVGADRAAPSRGRVTAVASVAILSAVALAGMIASPPSPSSGGGGGAASRVPPPLRSGTETRYTEIIGRSPRGELLRAGSDGAGAGDYGECEIHPAVAPLRPVTPTFTASYPGSGAKMTWNLIEAITGLVTGDDFRLNGHQNMVSIKTHYPSHEGREVPGAENIPRAILLLRHPLHSIPSYYNYIYEMENRLENHSTRAPPEAWIRWRDANFDMQLQVWRKHAEYWMDSYSPVNRLVISYESMTDELLGPTEATRVAEFLSRSEGVTTRPPEEIPCVWFRVVKYKKAKAKEGEEVAAAGGEGQGEAQEQQQPEQQQQQQQQMEGQAPQPPHHQQPQDPPTSSSQPPPCEGCSESNPEAPKSQRSGPEYVAPYTERQLRDTIQVLSSLLERYRDERAMAPVLVGYIDAVQTRVERARRTPRQGQQQQGQQGAPLATMQAQQPQQPAPQQPGEQAPPPPPLQQQQQQQTPQGRQPVSPQPDVQPQPAQLVQQSLRG